MLHLLGAGGAAGLAGCAGGQDDSTETPTGDDGGDGGTTPDQGEKLQQSATIALQSNFTAGVWQMYGGLSPYETRVLEPLVWVNPDFTLEPWLATDWEQTGDLTWEFTVRDGVTFHNGDTLTADHVVFSIKKLVENFPQARFSWNFAVENEDTQPYVPKVEALDDRTVEFTTRDPFPAFASGIAHNMVCVQHPETDAEKNKIVATGPYMVEEIETEQHAIVSRFEDYWNGVATMPELRYRYIADANTRALALASHEVDIALNPPTNKFKSIKNAKNTNALKQLAPRTGLFNFNINNPPTDDVKLRQALNYAVDQKAIVGSILNDIGQPARGPIAPMINWSVHDELPEYGPDMEKARQLVEESNYDGEPVIVHMTNSPQHDWAPINGQDIAEVVQHTAGEIGVNIEIQASEYSAFIDAWDRQDGHLYLFLWGTKSGAADYIMWRYHSRENPHHSPSKAFDAAIEKGETAKTDAEKQEGYGKAQRILMDQAVVLPLYYDEYIVGTYEDIEGLELHPLSQMVDWTGMKHLKR